MPDIIVLVINFALTFVVVCSWIVSLDHNRKKLILPSLVAVILWVWFGFASLAPRKVYETKICKVVEVDDTQVINYKDYWGRQYIVNLNNTFGKIIKTPTAKVEIYYPFYYGMLCLMSSEPKIILNENKGAKHSEAQLRTGFQVLRTYGGLYCLSN